MSTPRKLVLIAGLGHHISPEMQKRFDTLPGDAQKGLDSVLSGAAEAGFDYGIVFLAAEDRGAAVKALTEELQSRKWDGITIGYGIRGPIEYTALFEDLVNTAATVAPGIRFGFSPRPELVLETMQRMFPGAAKQG